MKGIILGLVLATGAASQCCHPALHESLELNAGRVKLCESRGGVPITAQDCDGDNHCFEVLRSCTFPCQQVFPGEPKVE